MSRSATPLKPIGVQDPTLHPQPLLRRPAWSLDGTWDFAADGARFDHEIIVPFAPETPASGIGTTERLERVAYRRTLAVERPTDGSRVLLHVGAVDRVATVSVNGRHGGSHEGGYDPMVVDLTDLLGDGSSTLVVDVVDDSHDLEAPRGKQEWLDQPHSIWYPRTTGIWRSTWLERVPATRVDQVDWSCSLAEMAVTGRVRVAGPIGAGCSVRIRLSVAGRSLAEGAVVLRGREASLTLAVGDGGIDDRWGLAWWPRRPVLVDAEVALLDAAGNVVDMVLSYTALREVTVRDAMVCLNGRPYPLRMVLDQGYWPDTGMTPPDSAALARDVDLTIQLGFNGARKHQKTEDPRWFAHADRAGLLAWVEMPSAYRPGPLASERLLTEWPRIVRAYRNHPSVIAWVPINESWGVPAAATNTQQRALIEALAAATDALDGTRPVSPNDGWETVGGAIVGVHDYTQDAGALAARFATPADVERVVRLGLPSGTAVDLDGRGAEGRAVVLSEFGGISLDDGGDTWGYQVVSTPADLLERYRAQWAAVHASTGLAGACWTQLTDTYQEANGLLRADRSPKVPLADFAKATKGAR